MKGVPLTQLEFFFAQSELDELQPAVDVLLFGEQEGVH